jgi:hypothetical protein
LPLQVGGIILGNEGADFLAERDLFGAECKVHGACPRLLLTDHSGIRLRPAVHSLESDGFDLSLGPGDRLGRLAASLGVQPPFRRGVLAADDIGVGRATHGRQELRVGHLRLSEAQSERHGDGRGGAGGGEREAHGTLQSVKWLFRSGSP